MLTKRWCPLVKRLDKYGHRSSFPVRPTPDPPKLPLYLSQHLILFLKLLTGETKAINFRETVAALQRADSMRDIQHLMYEWKERGKSSRENNQRRFFSLILLFYVGFIYRGSPWWLKLRWCSRIQFNVVTHLSFFFFMVLINFTPPPPPTTHWNHTPVLLLVISLRYFLAVQCRFWSDHSKHSQCVFGCSRFSEYHCRNIVIVLQILRNKDQSPRRRRIYRCAWWTARIWNGVEEIWPTTLERLVSTCYWDSYQRISSDSCLIRCSGKECA